MADEKIRLSIPDLSLVVLIGVSSSGKSTFAREHFLSTEVLSADFFSRHGRRRRKQPRGHGRCVCRPALCRRSPLGAGPVDRGRCDQCPARGAQAAGGTGQALSRSAGGHRLRPAPSDLQGACGRADRPRLAPPRDPPATPPATPQPQGPQARGLSPHFCAALAGRLWRGSKWCGRSCGRIAARSAGRSTSSAMSTGVAPNSKPCSIS